RPIASTAAAARRRTDLVVRVRLTRSSGYHTIYVVRNPDRIHTSRFESGDLMGTAVIDAPDGEQTGAWWFLDLLVVEPRCAPDMTTTVLEMTLPVGSSAPLHVHDGLDDTWYVIDGEMVVRCGDDTSVVGAGHWVSMPRGVPHTFRV